MEARARRKLRRYWPAVAAVAVAGLALASALIAERLTPHEVYPRENYSIIEDGLVLGGILAEPPPGTRAVLNVCETEDPYRAEAHRWDPVPDAAPAPGVDWLRRQVEFVAEQRQAGRPVFVHCRAGVSRSALVMAAYLMWRDGLGRDEALDRLRARRPRVGPNPAFLVLLLEWEELVKGPKDAAARSAKPTGPPEPETR